MKAKNTSRSYEEKIQDARASLAKWNQKREEERKANPINWNEVVPNYYKK
jgi:hypothetical protein